MSDGVNTSMLAATALIDSASVLRTHKNESYGRADSVVKHAHESDTDRTTYEKSDYVPPRQLWPFLEPHNGANNQKDQCYNYRDG
jgi:hypothetical protein